MEFVADVKVRRPRNDFYGKAIIFENKWKKDDEDLPYLELQRKYYRHFFNEYPGLYAFLNKYIDTDKFDIFDTEVCDTTCLSQLQDKESGALTNYINLHRLNDFRFLNKYILEVHDKLQKNGKFVGQVDTLEIERRRFYNRRLPGFLLRILYFLHFCYARVMPKLPVLQKVYFSISRGKNRPLSKAEVLGRLYYCGFQVKATHEAREHFYFIAEKVREPQTARPTYGPIIKLKRIGLNGKTIYIRKFRTMHPYSEYLQEYIYQNNKLQDNGKFNDDFRVTAWGRVLRKYWLDELPQIYNYLKGDINLVGVRALSEHYFSLYPKDLQQLRVQFTPGLVPPYYVDMPKSFDEILSSERKYLLKKKNRNFLVDDIYFCNAFFNIFIKKARSL